MRRFVALLVTLVLAAGFMSSAAAADDVTVHSVSRVETKGWSTRLDVSVTAVRDVSSLKVLITPAGATEPSVTVTDFALERGTKAEGVWRSAQPVDLPLGKATTTVEIEDVSGARVTKPSSAVYTRATTRFSEFEVSSERLNADHGPLTFRGRLVYQTREGDEQPLAGVDVRFVSVAGTIHRTTDANGEFSGSVTSLDRTANVYAGFFGSERYFAVYSERRAVAVDYAEVRLRATTAATPAVVGEYVTLVGTLERKTLAGEWKPIPYRYVTAKDADGKVVGTDRTTIDGEFGIPVPVADPARWSLYYDPENDSFGWGVAHLPASGSYEVNYRTRLVGLDIGPSPAAWWFPFRGRGRVLRTLADGTEAGAPKVYVEMQFSPDKKNWRTRSAELTDSNGYFVADPLAAQDGYWRTVVNGQYMHLPTPASAPKYIDTKYKTRITSFNASPEPVRHGKSISVTGRLGRFLPYTWKAGPGAGVSLYFKPKGSSKWTWMGSVKTDRNGWFRKGFKASRDGTWGARYWGSSSYLVSNLPTDYVDVR